MNIHFHGILFSIIYTEISKTCLTLFLFIVNAKLKKKKKTCLHTFIIHHFSYKCKIKQKNTFIFDGTVSSLDVNIKSPSARPRDTAP